MLKKFLTSGGKDIWINPEHVAIVLEYKTSEADPYKDIIRSIVQTLVSRGPNEKWLGRCIVRGEPTEVVEKLYGETQC